MDSQHFSWFGYMPLYCISIKCQSPTQWSPLSVYTLFVWRFLHVVRNSYVTVYHGSQLNLLRLPGFPTSSTKHIPPPVTDHCPTWNIGRERLALEKILWTNLVNVILVWSTKCRGFYIIKVAWSSKQTLLNMMLGANRCRSLLFFSKDLWPVSMFKFK